MQTLAAIAETVEAYNRLKKMVVSTLKLIQSIDDDYFMRDGIKEMKFLPDTKEIKVVVADEHPAQTFYNSFSIPWQWLVISQDELIAVVHDEKTIKKIKKEKELEEINARIDAMNRETERQQYLKLKAKFENTDGAGAGIIN